MDARQSQQHRAWRLAHLGDRAAYMRDWRRGIKHPRAVDEAVNRAKAKVRGAAYYAAHREEEAARDAAYRAAHREEKRVRDAAYHATHREMRRARDAANPERKRAYKATWYAKNRERAGADFAAWYALNADSQRAKARDAGARRRGAHACDHQWCLALGPAFLAWQISEHRCYLCGTPVWPGVNLHMDHVQPIAHGGTHCADNLRPSCANCNLRKGTHVRSSVEAETEMMTLDLG